MQIAEMSILARIKQTEEDEENSESILEKYYEARRELETLRERVSSEFEDQIESLESTKRSLEKKVRPAPQNFLLFESFHRPYSLQTLKARGTTFTRLWLKCGRRLLNSGQR